MASMAFENIPQNILDPKIEIRFTTHKGRGVFAKKTILENEVIETCQIIPFSSDDADKIELTFLSNYWFAWRTDDDPSQYGAICLGNGSLYNHSTHPNAHIFKDYDNKLMHFIASKEIPIGSEITVTYGTVWFSEEEKEE